MPNFFGRRVWVAASFLVEFSQLSRGSSLMRQERKDPRERPAELDAVLAHVNETNLYKVLGIPSGASAQDIDTAADRLLRLLHPDRWHDSPQRDDFNRASAIITNAAATLRDPEKYKTHCLRHGIALHRYAASARSDNSGTPSLDGEEIKGTLSPHVLSTDPHLFHDTQALAAAMRRAAAGGYFDPPKLFSKILPGSNGNPFYDLRCVRAARQPETQALFDDLLAGCAHVDMPFQKIISYLEIFGRTPVSSEAFFLREIRSRLMNAKIDTRLISETLWFRREFPRAFRAIAADQIINDRVRSTNSTSKQGVSIRGLQIALSSRLSAEEVVEQMLNLVEGEASDSTFWYNCACECLHLLPDRDAFFQSEKGSEIVLRLLRRSLEMISVFGLNPTWQPDEKTGELELVYPQPKPLHLRLVIEAVEKVLESPRIVEFGEESYSTMVLELYNVLYPLCFEEPWPFPAELVPEGFKDRV
jgi:hypothetical protein